MRIVECLPSYSLILSSVDAASLEGCSVQAIEMLRSTDKLVLSGRCLVYRKALIRGLYRMLQYSDDSISNGSGSRYAERDVAVVIYCTASVLSSWPTLAPTRSRS